MRRLVSRQGLAGKHRRGETHAGWDITGCMAALRISLKLAPQHTTIADLRRVWQIADEAGFDTCWTFDHFASIGGTDPTGDVFEGWTHLAAMAEGTKRVRIGCMVTATHTGIPACSRRSPRRLITYPAGGWSSGLARPGPKVSTPCWAWSSAPRDRLDRLEEACQIILSLWTKPTTTLAGRHYRLMEALSNPKPVQQPHPPLWVGGSGRRRTLRITAQLRRRLERRLEPGRGGTARGSFGGSPTRPGSAGTGSGTGGTSTRRT
jgi:Luciferase-like monooxygenase